MLPFLPALETKHFLWISIIIVENIVINNSIVSWMTRMKHNSLWRVCLQNSSQAKDITVSGRGRSKRWAWSMEDVSSGGRLQPSSLSNEINILGRGGAKNWAWSMEGVSSEGCPQPSSLSNEINITGRGAKNSAWPMKGMFSKQVQIKNAINIPGGRGRSKIWVGSMEGVSSK